MCKKITHPLFPSADVSLVGSLEQLEALRKCVPTADEVEVLRGYDGDKEMLV